MNSTIKRLVLLMGAVACFLAFSLVWADESDLSVVGNRSLQELLNEYRSELTDIQVKAVQAYIDNGKYLNDTHRGNTAGGLSNIMRAAILAQGGDSLLRSKVLANLNNFATETRIVMELRFRDGKKINEIAIETGKNLSTVRTIIYQAFGHLLLAELNQAAVKKALETFPFKERDVKILRYRFGLEDGIFHTLKETAEKFNIDIKTVFNVEERLEEFTKGSRQFGANIKFKPLPVDFLDTLPSKDRELLRYRYGLTDGRVHTLEETGIKFGITHERVGQIEARAHEIYNGKRVPIIIGGNRPVTPLRSQLIVEERYPINLGLEPLARALYRTFREFRIEKPGGK